MSNEPTTEMMNEVIAVFDGWERYEDKYGIWFKKEGMIKCLHHKLQELKYHTSWDALMPIVVRIKNDESLRLRAPCLGITDSIWPYINAMKYMNQRLLKADITGTHAGVYKFITWYNQQKQNDGTKQ